MSVQRVIGGEGSSEPLVWTTPAATPAVMVFPMLSSQTGLHEATAQEIYRLAYERAQAALRPSRYERGRRVCSN